jgi:hypothetical protein
MMMAWMPDHLNKPANDFVRVANAYVRDNPHLLDVEAGDLGRLNR